MAVDVLADGWRGKYTTMRTLIGAVYMLLALTLLPTAAIADVVFDFNHTFAGANPSGAAPWLSATFHTAGENTVTLTLTSNLHSASEFVTEFYFNTNPNEIPPTSLTLVQNSGVLIDGKQLGEDCCRAGSDGKYDLQINFKSGPPSKRFKQGSTATFTLTGNGITENYFDFLSSPAGGAFGPFHAAAHVQGIPIIGSSATNSAWVTDTVVPNPEPGSIFLLLTAACGVGFAVRRRFTAAR